MNQTIFTVSIPSTITCIVAQDWKGFKARRKNSGSTCPGIIYRKSFHVPEIFIWNRPSGTIHCSKTSV